MLLLTYLASCLSCNFTIFYSLLQSLQQFWNFKYRSERKPEEELRKSFRLYDADDTGKITFENLKDTAHDLGEDITDDEIRDMIKEADMDGDGEINLDEFIQMMKNAKFL